MSAKHKGKFRPQPAGKPVQKPVSRAPVSKPKPAVALTQTFAPGFWRRHWLPALLLVALAFALYGQAARFGYVLDDEMVLRRNVYVKQGFAGWGGIFGFDTFKGFEDFVNREGALELLPGGRYRPLSLATFAAEVSLFGQPGPGLARISHFINILLYGLTGMLLYRILLGLFPPSTRGWWFSAAFLGAALFVLHPLHVEAVANIKGRDEILALLFSLGALYFTLRYFDTNQKWRLVTAEAAFFLGLLSKENTLTFLAVIPLTAWFFGRVPARRLAVPTISLAGVALLFIAAKWHAQGYLLDHGKPATDLMNNPFLGMSPGDRLATIFLTLGWYVKLLFLPHPLTHDYYPYQVPRVSWSDWRALASLALYSGLAVWALLNLRRRRVPAYAIAFFLLTLSIVSNLFVSVGTFMNERFLYMPSVAFCLPAGWFLARQIPRWTRGEADGPSILGTGLFVVTGALFAWLTVARVPDWATKLSLNTSAAKNSPNSARAHCFYAIALFEEVYKPDKKKPAAEQMTFEARMALLDTMDAHLTRATTINPKYLSAWRMVPGVAFARFELQRDQQRQKGGPGPQMDRLFNDFRHTLHNAPNEAEARRYISECVAYLAKNGGNPNKIVSFCYDVGYEFYFKQHKDPQMALRLLEAGLLTQFEDERLFNALADVYETTNNPAKAAEMRQRAAVARTIDPSK